MNPQGIAGVIKMGKKKPAEFKKLIKQMAKKGLGESINEAVRVLAIKEGVKTSKAFNNFQKSRSSFLERWGKLKKQLNTIKTESPNNEYLRLEKQLYKFETAFIEHSAKIMSSVSKISKSNLTESVNEAKYKGYDWKRQNRKDGHPLIVPALQKTFANMKDLKKYIDKHGTMESVNEKISKEEWAQYPAYARKLKPYMQKLLKVPLKVRVIKQANHNPWIEVRVAKFGKDIIPNDFRKKALKAIGGGNPRDMDNITYGNITASTISMLHNQWVKIIGDLK
jgi:hypothetical protein